MAKAVLLIVLIIVFLVVSASGDPQKQQTSGQKTWCVAKPSTSYEALVQNMKYACHFVDCSILSSEGNCFQPDTMMSHASVAMNLYYQAEGQQPGNCNFTNSGLTVITDPSFDNCNYA